MQDVLSMSMKSCPKCRAVEDALFPFGLYSVDAAPPPLRETVDPHVMVWVCRRCGHVELRAAA